ncbi:hypothetical protein CFC21_070133, partial [Triticum aestivum]
MAVATTSPMLGALLLLALFSAAGVHGAAPSSPLDQLCGSLGSFYVTPELCASALCVDAPPPAAPRAARRSSRRSRPGWRRPTPRRRRPASSPRSPSTRSASRRRPRRRTPTPGRACGRACSSTPAPSRRCGGRRGPSPRGDTAARGRCWTRRSTSRPGAPAWLARRRCPRRTTGSAPWPSSRTPSLHPCLPP